MGLFDPIWKTNDYSKTTKAEAAVRKITDPKKLYEISTTAPMISVRAAAVENIHDDQMLFDIAMQNEFFVAEAAFKKIENPSILKELALRGSDDIRYGELLPLIKNNEALIEIASNASSKCARETAVEEIEDPDAVLNFAFSQDLVMRHVARKAFDSKYIGQFRRRKEVVLTDAQFGRYIDALIFETSTNYDISIPLETGTADLQRIYQNAGRPDVREKAFLRLMGEVPAESLLSFYKEARANHWRDVQDNVERRIANRDSDKADVIYSFVKDPDAGCNMASRCIQLLFSEKLDAVEGIENMRSDAVQAYLANMPSWETQDSYHNEEYAICQLATSLPASVRSNYGFEVSGYDYEDEDEFGRYTSHSTTVVYNGKTYHC